MMLFKAVEEVAADDVFQKFAGDRSEKDRPVVLRYLRLLADTVYVRVLGQSDTGSRALRENWNMAEVTGV